ncbi:glutamic-type intramembrane protease PrsW [Oceanobacillus sp. J11TS1]|uniref:glutamic-type intramembrane protease PrsW n=1 Tax=Oceanobacillus sp. J11TS1 TaxID=2807191 RepID=UPI001B2D37B8|nr:glutamic-type intramembrane protease PrsW [Oceanobacillus sp. J11TS1]GIO22603.1 protease PrsW [Oceanobacillus sp. J11TS1]
MVAALSAGIAPAVAFMTFIYLRDRITEPLWLIARMFVTGALIVLPIMFIQYGIHTEMNHVPIIMEAFLFSAFLEEFFKWFMFMFLIYQHEEFDNHYDGIVYASAISLGFASLENVFYLLSNGIEFAWMRALYPVSSHALFGIIMGYYLGKAKMYAKYKRRYSTMAFVLPVLLHGIYNYILLGLNQFIITLSIFLACVWIFAIYRLKHARMYDIRFLPNKINKKTNE